MKIRLLFAAAAILALAGCTSHYLRTGDGQTHLVLKTRNAGSVMFASSLDRFQWRPAEKISRNTWQVTIPTDVPQSYYYVVDNEIFLPDCRFKEKDDFGSQNCVYVPGM